MSLVEHVARALRDTGDAATKPGLSARAAGEVLARAAIHAMREPTVEMVEAARRWSDKRYGKPIDPDGAAECWRAMIDIALAEGAPQ